MKLEKKYPGNFYPSYYAGILCMQIGKILYLPNPDKAYDYFDRSLDYFFKTKKIKYTAEVAALISEAYGKKSSLSTLRAIYFGLLAKDYIYEAADMDSSNVKVYLIAATHLMHVPESFGGDKHWAESLLKKALKLRYAKESEDSLLIDWANDAELYAYLAQLEILRGNKEKANLYMDKALSLIPNYGFVKYDLARQLRDLK